MNVSILYYQYGQTIWDRCTKNQDVKKRIPDIVISALTQSPYMYSEHRIHRRYKLNDIQNI